MSGPWEDFAPKPKEEAGPWDDFTPKSQASRAPAPRAPAGVLDRLQAVGAGVNHGVLADLLGLPVNAVANVLDLGRMGVGTVAAMAGRPDLMPELPDRSKIAGTTEWIARKIGQGANAIGVQSPVAPARPDDAISRVAFSTGRGIGTSISPDPRAKLSAGMQLTNAAMGGVSGLSAGTVGEVAPEWAGLAGMLPQAGVNAGASVIKRTVRGGEAGRQAMEQRLTDLNAGGIENPSVGLASGNKFVSGLENLLSHTPGSMSLYDRAHAANVAGMQAKTEAIRDAISTEHGPVVAGQAIQNDLKVGFPQRTKETAKALADRVAALVGRDTVVPVDNSLDAATRLSTPIPGAEATSAAFIQPRIASLANNLRTDVYGARPNPQTLNVSNPTLSPPMSTAPSNAGLWNQPAQPISNASLWNVPVMPQNPMPQRPGLNLAGASPGSSLMNAQKEQGIPFAALKQLRSNVGEETQSNAIMGTPEQGQFKQLYGALSDDMRNAAGTADRARAGVSVGPLQMADQPATIAMNRANQHFSTAMSRAEELNGIANRDTPEGAYGAVASSLKAGPTVYERLRSAITPEARQKVVATVVNDMGMAAPGQQNADGSLWSPRSFLSNYNRMDSGARDALFTRLPGGQAYADNLSKVAKAAEMMGDSSKVWANPSGTSHALAARGAAGTIALGAVGGLFYKPLLLPAAVAGGSMAGANVTSRLLLNQKFVNWLAKAPNVPPDQAQAYMQRLTANAALTKDPQFQQDASAYLQLIQDGQQQQYDDRPK